jgi:GH15 family glucan-1,4-alpha-glucosidase
VLVARRDVHAAGAAELGLVEEPNAWRMWLRHAVAGDPAQVQTMYGLAGARRLDERELPWLAGYRGAHPVRTGNGAAKQLQLDIFGEVIDALFQSTAAGLGQEHPAWDLQVKLLEHWSRFGTCRTTGCGRCAARRASSPTPR